MRGERANYRPITSPLVASSQPIQVASAYLKLYPFSILYIADLDAIQGSGDNIGPISALRDRFPQLELWIDAGIADVGRLETWLSLRLGRPVLGAESIRDPDLLRGAAAACEPVLSLDFLGGRFLGPCELIDRPERWTQRVIAMTLAKVGSREGPDLALLADLRRRAPTRQWFAAGGVRDSRDLAALDRTGVRGVLLASALHDGSLSRADLSRFADNTASP